LFLAICHSSHAKLCATLLKFAINLDDGCRGPGLAYFCLIYSVYGLNHLIYSAIKLSQGYFEQQLKYPVSTAKTKRQRLIEVSKSKSSGSHGVKLAQRGKADLMSLIPGINAKVATYLTENKITIARLCLMTESELKSLDGIGPKTANKIYEALHGA
jgi:predicted flap endonuclease-1-like 5' DNA nuclease